MSANSNLASLSFSQWRMWSNCTTNKHIKVFVSALTMPKQLKKDELGRLAKPNKPTEQTSTACWRATEVETPVLKNLAARPPSGSPRPSNPAPDAALGMEPGLAELELEACTALLSAVITHLDAVLGSKSDLLCADKNNIWVTRWPWEPTVSEPYCSGAHRQLPPA